MPIKLLYPTHVGAHKNIRFLQSMLRSCQETLPVPVLLTLTATKDDLLGSRTLASWLGSSVELVQFIGSVERSELPDLYASHDILVFPSLCESFGFPLLEAMVSGMPIAVSNLDWAHELCGKAALYADPHDPSAWARILADHTASGTRANQLGMNRAAEFTWRRAADDYARVLLGA
jgi:glycosyltransferase involved in cell wall biosynthesis